MIEHTQKRDARTLFEYLRGKGFVHRRDIPADLFGGHDTSRRRVRAICTAFPEHFVSTQDGYCIAAEAPTDSLRECIATLRSQAAKMHERADGLQTALDRRENRQRELQMAGLHGNPHLNGQAAAQVPMHCREMLGLK